MMILARIWRLLDRQQRRQLIALQLLSVLMALSAVVGIAGVVPFFAVLADPHSIERNLVLRVLYQHLRFASQGAFLIALGSAFVGLVLLANAVNLFGMLAINRFALRVGDTFIVRLFDLYLRRDFGIYLRSSSAALANKLLHESGRVSTGVLRQSLILGSNLVMIVLLLGAILLVNPLVALGAVVAVGSAYAAIYAVTRGLLLRNGRNQSRFQAKRTQLVGESLGAIREIIMLDARDFFVQRFAEHSDSYTRIELTTLAISAGPRNILECAIVLCLVGIALYLRSLSDEVGPWLAQLSFIGLAAYRLMPSIQQAFVAVVSIRANYAAFENVAVELKEALSGPGPARSGSDSVWRMGPCREVRIHDLSLRYAADDAPALSGLSLRVPAGSSVGFVGPNGSGKTTLVDVLAGLLVPTSGHVEIDGTLLDDTNRHAWRSAIAYVPQQVFLLDATFAENIALGIPRQRIDPERLDYAVTMARLTECLASLPGGYDEMLGDRGCRLSGGQRQRLGIARALYRDAPVLILDEATSALDNAAEEEIVRMLDALRPGRTLMLIAHRLSALRYCDIIHELRNGKIARSSTYAELQAGMRTPTVA
jgi:ATP-binding cassette, subfamily B, bacterial PglK